MTTAGNAERKDFFVSYNSADANWAEWIAWTLEQAGYSTVLQAWDFRPGSNFVLEMQRAAEQADRLIVVLSPEYLAARFPQPEWASAFAGDPEGLDRRLVPVMIHQCEPTGLLAAVVQIRLVGLDADRARETLLAGINPGRAKPLTEPAFPAAGGTGSVEQRPSDSFSTSAQLSWTPLTSAAEVMWRADIEPLRTHEPSVLELHLIPVQPMRLEVRMLASLGDQLIALGRSRGMFTMSEAVRNTHDESKAVVSASSQRDSSYSGLSVLRQGQVSGWLPLPRDAMGSVLDPDDVRVRVQALLETLLGVDVQHGQRVTFAVGIDPIDMITSGRASDVGHRSQSTLPLAGRGLGPLRVAPDDALDIGLLSQTSSIADELAARLTGRFSSLGGYST